jgi:hypothetical protein
LPKFGAECPDQCWSIGLNILFKIIISCANPWNTKIITKWRSLGNDSSFGIY